MRKNKFIAHYLAIIFLICLAFIFIGGKTVNAATTISPKDFDDGLTGWWEPSSRTSQMQEIPIGPDLKLGYTFGLAQNTTGQVRAGLDSTVADESSSTSANNVAYSKMNVFLDVAGTYYSSAFQTGFSSALSAPGQVSLTSPNFLIAPSNTTKPVLAAPFSILGTGSKSTGNYNNVGLTNKHYYVTTDPDGHLAFKIVGDFNRAGSSSYGNGTYSMEVEILLRASPTNSAIVQREMYVKNTENVSQSFTTLFGEDTKLGSSSSSSSSIPDQVPIYDLGNKQGIFITNSDAEAGTYRLMITNQMPDGFQSYNGQAYTSSGSGNNWAKGLSGEVVSGTGAEIHNYANAYPLLGVSVTADSSYVLKWKPTTLAPGQTAHFGSTMGVTAKPYSIPTATKTYTNESRTDGINKSGNKLKFTLKMVNNGYGAAWNFKQINDTLPKGLQIDTSSIRRSFDGGATEVVDPTDYDQSTRQLTVPMPYQLTDDQSATVTFEATITNDANDTNSIVNVINTGEFEGSDAKISPNKVDTFKVAATIPVSPPDFSYTFTKQVKNISNNETEFHDSTTAKKGDIVDYYIDFSVKGGQDTLKDGSQFSDELPDGITRDGMGNAQIKGPGDSSPYGSSQINTRVNAIGNNQNLTVEFKAKVTANSVNVVTNNAKMVGTTTGNVALDVLSNNSDLNIQKVDAITSVPTSIDFGSTNLSGKTKILNNVSTTGELIVTHPDSNNFNINVSYDNDNADSQMKDSQGNTLPTDDSGLIFIRQRDNADTDLGTWKPLLPDGTPIQSTPFTGNKETLNLTNYIGVNNWQIKLSPNTESGVYNGTVTWSMVESE